jgi:predicted DNA-binding ribbon-helix-helix protein
MQVAADVPMTRSVDTEIKRVTVTLPKWQLDALQTIATREDVSVAWLVRKAVDKLLRQGHEIPVTDSAQRKGRT